jgi:aryl-alcohol dehydrogenase-like predicted oxidoreductase
MNTRKLGWTDLHLTEIGFGAWAIGGGDWRFGWGPQDDDDSVAAIHRALELGVNWIDTAAIYGLGHSEEVVARAIEGRRDSLILATKCSQVWNERREVSHSLKKESILAECEASLKRLKTDRIDLYQIHWPSEDDPIEEGWEAMSLLVEQGKIRYAAVSNFRPDQMDRCVGVSVASLQPPYSMMRRAVESLQYPYCEQHQIGVVAYSPMQAGLLTGRFDINRVAANDWRRNSPEFNEPNLHVNLEFVGKLWPIALKYGKTVAQLALAWTLRLPVVTSAIAGARNPKQIEETVGGAGWKIDDADLMAIDELLAWRLEECRKAGGVARG